MTPSEMDAQAGPVQVRGTVLTVRRVDAYHAMTLVAPAIAARFKPGQFVTLAVGGPDIVDAAEQGVLHPRRAARSRRHGGVRVRRARPRHPVAGRAAGQGRARRHRPARQAVPAAARSGELPADRRRLRQRAAVRAGGRSCGSGAARSTSCSAPAAATGCSARSRRGAPGRSATITTEDGSLGARGLVTDMLDQVIHDGRTDVIYACGPMPMLRQVTALARRYDIPVQAAVEEAMACGIGVCMTCVLPVIGVGRDHPDGAVVRRRPGLPRRVGALGRRRHDPVRRVRRARLGAAVPARGAARSGQPDHDGNGAADGLGRAWLTLRLACSGRRTGGAPGGAPGGAARGAAQGRRQAGREAGTCQLTCGPGSATWSCPTRS